MLTLPLASLRTPKSDRLLEDTGANLDIDDSWGWAAEAGVDYLFANDWLVSGQVWYPSIEPDADVTGGTLGLNERNLKVEINPWIFKAGFCRPIS